MSSCMADGGEVDSDHESVMDQCALECIHAIESKDTEGFMDALHVLVADILVKLQADPEGEEDEK